MKYLVYMSTAVLPLTTVQLRELLRKSQAYNIVNSITGMLLYSDGSFIQALEGLAEDLDPLLRKIQKDKTHKNIVNLVTGKLNNRVFPSWSMGFKRVPAIEFSRFDAYINPSGINIYTEDDIHPTITLIKSFAGTNSF